MQLIKNQKFDKENEITLLNIPVFQYGKKFGSNGYKKYLSIFPKSLEQEFLYEILEPIYKKHDYIFIVRTLGIGEAYIFNFMVDEIINKHKVKSPCFITPREIYKDMFRLYHNDIPCYVTEYITPRSYNTFLKHRILKYKGIPVEVIHATISESDQIFRNFAKGFIEPYPNVIKKLIDTKNFSNITPQFKDTDKNVINLVKDLNISNFVFLLPEAQSILPLPDKFWVKITNILNSYGYDVYVNTKDGFSEYGKSAKLTISQALYLANFSKAIISLRCGFVELFSQLNIPKFVVYNNFRYVSISSTQMKKIFSLKNYPFVNRDTIFEYDIVELEQDKIIENILTQLGGQNVR